jgi:putative membrane protein
MNNFYSGHMFGWGFDGGIMMLIFWVAAILLIVWAVQSFAGKNNQKTSALDILKERYAKGEINKEEFEAKKLAITNAN